MLYHLVSVSLSPHQKSSFFQWVSIKTETYNWEMYRALSPKGDVFIKLFPSKSGVYAEEKEDCKEPEVMDSFKERASSRYNRTDTHMNSQTPWQHTKCLYRFVMSHPEKERWRQSPTPNQEAACNWCLQRKVSNGVSLETATLQGRSHGQSWLDKTKWILWCQNMLREWGCMRILSKYENTPRKQEDSWGLSFFKNLELSLECVYTFLPGVSERSCVYFKFLTTACCCYSIKCLRTSTVKLIFATCSLVWLHAAMRIYEDFTMWPFFTLGV